MSKVDCDITSIEERSQQVNDNGRDSALKAFEKPLVKEKKVEDVSGENIGLADTEEKVLEEQTDAKQKSKGVTEVERVKDSMLSNDRKAYFLKALLGLSVLVCAWAFSLDSSTTSNYRPFAASDYGNHSTILSTVAIATKVISAVSKPFVAKFGDIVSRPSSYLLVLVFYVVGYIIAAGSHSMAGYIVGLVFGSIGSSGIDVINDIIVGDLTPLKWRGFAGAMLGMPFVINTWYAGLIVEGLGEDKWRWGYGIFTIIAPVVLCPAVAVLYYVQRTTNKQAQVSIASGKLERIEGRKINIDFRFIKDEFIKIDPTGLVLLGVGFCLVLLPLSLYTGAENGWRNPSIIAMVIVGGILLSAFFLFEYYLAPHPLMPRKVFNRTFLFAVIIDTFSQMTSSIRSLYLSSFVWIVKDWGTKEWTYYNNTLTLTLCVFGVVAGIIQRLTHRYKYLQIIGLCIKIVGEGILVKPHAVRYNTAALVFTQLLTGIGGAFSVVGCRVASQASVPHENMALAIAIVSLWSSIGFAIGSAIAGPLWSSKMPGNLRRYMPNSVSDSQVKKFYGNIKSIRKYPFDSEVRQSAIKAYSKTNFYHYAIALGLSFIQVIAACFQRNYFLGDTQNAVDKRISDTEKDITSEKGPPQTKTWKNKLADFYSKPLSG